MGASTNCKCQMRVSEGVCFSTAVVHQLYKYFQFKSPWKSMVLNLENSGAWLFMGVAKAKDSVHVSFW